MRNKGPNPLTRSFESNGPDVKIRGTAQHIADKYAQLARDAQAGSDPVSAENYLQHAEHYYRLIAAAQEQFKQQYGAFQRSDEEGDDGDDEMQGPNGFGHPGERMGQDEFGDGGYGQPPYEGRPNGGERPMQPPRYDRNDRGEYRQDRPNNDRPNNDRQDRGDTSRNDNYRGGDRQRFDRNEQRFDRNAPNGAGPERAPQGYDRGEGQRPDQRNGVDARPEAGRPEGGRPDGSRPDGGRPDGNRRDRFNRDGNRDQARGDAPRQDGGRQDGRRDFARPERGPRQDSPRQDQPRQDHSRQDAPRHALSDEAEEAGLPAFLLMPVRSPASAPAAGLPSTNLPDDAQPSRAAPAVAHADPAQSGTDEAVDPQAQGDAVTGIRPRKRRTRKVAGVASEAPAADDTAVD